jgi:6-phospho-3-hexuloisomerase
MLEALSCVYSSIPEDASLRLAQSVQAHRRIFVSGAGRSRLMLMAFAMRLTQMGYIAFVAGDVTTPAITADDLLIVASASGTTHSVCHCAGVAQQCGADLFSISTRSESPLAIMHPVDVLITAPSKTGGDDDRYPIGTLFEQALLLFLDDTVATLPFDPQIRTRHANLE